MANKLFIRVRYNDGKPDRFEIPITHAGDRGNEVSFTDNVFPSDGYIEALTVDTGIVDRGECYVAAFVDHEEQQLHYPIFAGYITPVHTPLGFFEHALSGRGLMRSIDLGDPAANAEYTTQTVPTGALWIVRGFSGVLTTDANAGNRYWYMGFTDGTDEIAGSTDPAQFVASLAVRMVGGSLHGLSSYGGNANPPTGIILPFPIAEIRLPAGYEVTFNNVGFKAGDDWSDGQLAVEEWIAP